MIVHEVMLDRLLVWQLSGRARPQEFHLAWNHGGNRRAKPFELLGAQIPGSLKRRQACFEEDFVGETVSDSGDRATIGKEGFELTRTGFRGGGAKSLHTQLAARRIR